MIFRAVLILFLAVAMPVSAAVKVTSGEHATFSRLVFPATDDITYKVISGPKEITVILEGLAQEFDLSEVFDRIPKTRLLAIEQSQNANTAKLSLSLGCECLGLAYRLNQYLVIDVIGEEDTRFAVLDNTQESLSSQDSMSASTTAPAPRKRSEVNDNRPKPRVLRPPEVVDLDPRSNLLAPIEGDITEPKMEFSDAAEKARASLIRQLKAAAEEGLIELPQGLPATELAQSNNAPDGEMTDQDGVKALIAQVDALESIRIRPVDEVPDAEITTEDVVLPKRVCIPENRLDPENWADDRDFNAQLANLHELLLGEFDQPGEKALGDLIKFYLHYGFGVEAKQLLKTYPTAFPDRQILEQISLIINGEKSNAPDFFGTPDCDGRAGLWRALNGQGDAILGAQEEETILAAYGELPTLMRDQLAKRFISGLIENDRIELAEKLLDINNRSPNIKESEIKLLKAKLLIKEERRSDADEILTALVAQNEPNYQEALIELGSGFIQRGARLPPGFSQDLENASLENRDTAIGRDLFKTLVLANISGGDPIFAFAVLERDGEEILGSNEELPELVSQAVQTLLTSPAKPADVARIAISSAGLIDSPAVSAELKSGLAARLVEDGLSNLALNLLDGIPRSDTSRLTASRALIATGLAEEALQELGILDTPEARIMRARLKSRDGDHQGAREELGKSDDPNFYSDLGWLQADPTASSEIQDEKSQGRADATRLLDDIDAEEDRGSPTGEPEPEVTLEGTRTILEAAVEARKTAETLVEEP